MDLNISDELIQARVAQAATYGGEYLHERTFQGVIFPEGYGFLWDDIAFPYWTPTRDVILSFESQIHNLIEEYSSRFDEIPARYAFYMPQILAGLQEYGRQYSGTIHDGRLALYVNCFTSSWNECDWIEQPFHFDTDYGGIFKVLYDLEENQIVYLIV